jgi:hypothetical protein
MKLPPCVWLMLPARTAKAITFAALRGQSYLGRDRCRPATPNANVRRWFLRTWSIEGTPHNERLRSVFLHA